MNLNDLKIGNIIDNKYSIFYTKTDSYLQYNFKNLKYLSCIFNNEDNFYILKIIVKKNHELVTLMESLKLKIFSYLLDKKIKTKDTIHQFYFSNMTKYNENEYLLSLKMNSPDILQNSKDLSNFNCNIQFLGIWFHDEYFGISLKIS